ncbi:hypothetical protein M404DRAFT_23931 [Pisolithus tinctorius Marx 270]|uniref:Uncharacterized protein n=1 Tax=Pisolithus tinctorius Marx 270 TaxID=870435 RepID=A0A0C3JEC0_PISTI|nr:hypothetical protein M404DRAFT_23931 [Pisolithus tinctorius Marx 270]
MSSQHQRKTPQPNPGHVCDYSQVVDEELVVLTDDSTDTEWEKEREHEAECKAKCEEAKRWKVEEEKLEVEQRKRVEEEEEAWRKKAAEEEAKRQRQRASEERAQARQDEAAQRLCGMVYNVNTAQRVPGTSVVVTATRWPPCTHCGASLMVGQCKPGQGKTRACMPCHKKKKLCSWMREDTVAGLSWKRVGTGSSQGEKKKRPQGKGKERAMETEEVDNEWEAGGEEDEPATLLKGPSGAGVHMQMAEAVEQMVVATEQTANEWALYHAWAEWVEMRRSEDVHEARMAELEHAGGSWKRPQLEVAEDQHKEVDEGAEGDNEEEEVGGGQEVGGEQEGREEQEGGGEEQVMEE